MKTERPVATRKKKILIVDDHPFLREGLKTVLNQQDDLVVCCEAADAPQALAAIAEGKPDAAIVDLTLGERSGLDLVKDIHVRDPHLAILVLSVHDESLYAERVLRAGAKGYVMKREPLRTVIAALRRILDGNYYVSEKIAARVFGQFMQGRSTPPSSPSERLSDRELEVFELIGEGYRRTKIAQRLNMSVKTVEYHCENIKRKLGLRDADELHRQAIQWSQSERV